MKKIFALALALLALAGCGSSSCKTGLGMTVRATSENLFGKGGGMSQYEVTSCAVTLDAGGKIVSVSWDVVRCRTEVSAGGKIAVKDAVRTKKELKENYDMKGSSPIGKEWYEQIAALEAYAIGKTPAEVSGMKVTQAGAPDVEDLKSSCTISCGDLFESLNKAAANAQ